VLIICFLIRQLADGIAMRNIIISVGDGQIMAISSVYNLFFNGQME